MQKEKLNILVSQINNTESIYLQDILHLVSDALEVISGFSKNRIYLSAPSRFNHEQDLMEPVHIRGYPQNPVKSTFLSLDGDGKRKYPLPIKPLSDTLEIDAYENLAPLIATDYDGSGMEGSAFLGRTLLIRSSLIFPITYKNARLGVGTIDSAEHVSEEVLRSLLKPVNAFLRRVIPKLAEAAEYWSGINKGKRLNELMNSLRVSSALGVFEQKGIADLSVFLLPQQAVSSGRTRSSLLPVSFSAVDDDGLRAFEEAAMAFGGAMEAGSRDFFLTSEMMEEDSESICPLVGKQNLPVLVSFKDMACPFEIEMNKKGGFTAGIYYLAVDSDGDTLFAIVLYLRKDSLRKARNYMYKGRDTHLEDLFMNVVKKINTTLYDIQDCSLVTDQLLGIYQINDRYEKFNRMKDIRRGLTGFLKMILQNIMVLTRADNGIIGILEDIGGKKFITVEKEGGVIVGAKSGDIADMYIRPLRVGTKEELLTKELSLAGMAAAYQRPMVYTGIEKPDEKVFLSKPFPHMESAIAAPVVVVEKTIAVIHLSAQRKYSFAGKSQIVLEMISQLVKDNVHKLLKKYRVSEEVIRLYGGSYPYIKNDALNYLAELFDNYVLDLNRFMDDIRGNYRIRRKNKKDKENYITLKDVKKAFFDSKFEEINLLDYMEETDNIIANHIYMRLKNRQASFFDDVQSEYAKHTISRRVAVLIFEKAKLAVKKTQITKIAVHLNVCSENYQGNYEEKKKIERFREFYKKTIGIKL